MVLYDALDPYAQQREQTKAYENGKKARNLIRRKRQGQHVKFESGRQVSYFKAIESIQDSCSSTKD